MKLTDDDHCRRWDHGRGEIIMDRCQWCRKVPPARGHYTCGARICRTLSRYYLRAIAGYSFRGPLYNLRALANFLEKMANPQCVNDREFAKRYPHRRRQPL